MTDDKLKALFDEFGKVTDFKAVVDRDSGECKGYGFVRFSTMEEAEGAVEKMNSKDVFPEQPALQVSLRSGKGEGKGEGKGKGGEKGFGGGGKGGKGKGKGGKGPGAGGMMGPCGPSGLMPPMGMYPGMPGQTMPPMYG
ncbi:unnamed protein product, partial [Polarella glacialis]